jgi:hypothetical protein
MKIEEVKICEGMSRDEWLAKQAKPSSRAWQGKHKDIPSEYYAAMLEKQRRACPIYEVALRWGIPFAGIALYKVIITPVSRFAQPCHRAGIG